MCVRILDPFFFFLRKKEKNLALAVKKLFEFSWDTQCHQKALSEGVGGYLIVLWVLYYPEESFVEDVIEGAQESSEESEEEENRLYSTDEEHLLANPNGGIDTD